MSHFFAMRKLMPAKTFAISFRFVEGKSGICHSSWEFPFSTTRKVYLHSRSRSRNSVGSETLKSAGAVIGSTILHYRVPILLKKGE